MIDNELKLLLDEYIAAHFTGDESVKDNSPSPSVAGAAIGAAVPLGMVAGFMPIGIAAGFFDELFEKRAGKTFSEMLLRLIDESGEKPATIYKRADIDRQIFSRIKQNKNYRPTKDTAISFAFALKLDMPTTKKLLSAAGYALTDASKRDIIISYFIEHKDFDLNTLNETLYDYGQDVLLKR